MTRIITILILFTFVLAVPDLCEEIWSSILAHLDTRSTLNFLNTCRNTRFFRRSVRHLVLDCGASNEDEAFIQFLERFPHLRSLTLRLAFYRMPALRGLRGLTKLTELEVQGELTRSVCDSFDFNVCSRLRKLTVERLYENDFVAVNLE